MISVDMGIEAALNTGVTLPVAPGGASGPGSAASLGSGLRSDRAAADGPGSFRAALIAARGEDKAVPATGCPAKEEETPAVQKADEQACEVETLEAEKPPVEAQPKAVRVEALELGWLDPVGLQWIDAQQADLPTEAYTAPEAGKLPAIEIVLSAEDAEGVALLGRLELSVDDSTAKNATQARPVIEGIECVPTAFETGSEPPKPEIPADMQSPSRAAFLETVPQVSVTEEEAALIETPPELDDPATRSMPQAVDSLSTVRQGRATLRAAEPAQTIVRPAPASDALPAQAHAVAEASPSSVPAAAPATLFASALQTANPKEGVHGRTVSELFGPAETESGLGGQVREQRPAAAADPGDSRQAAEDLLFSKMPAAGKAVAGEGEAFPEGLATLNRDMRSNSAPEGISQQTRADGLSVWHDKEPVGATGRSGVFDQIVQRAAVHLNSDRGEISIDLKPDFLGRVRMQIHTENQQVTVRILTELPAVRDMIETGLVQLKSELQSQGLQVERIEVAVADEHRQRDWQQAHTAQAWKTTAAGEHPDADPASAERLFEPVYRRPRADGRLTIDMFV
jgi:flagellar hook-length control protein FliK